MKINCNCDYFKILESEIPDSYLQFLQALPELLSPEPLPPKYNLRYRDHESFPIKVNNERSFKIMVQDMKKSEDELILFVTSEEQDENLKNMNNILTTLFDGQSNYSQSFSNLKGNPYKSLKNQGPIWPQIKLEEGVEESPMTVHNSPHTTIDELFFGNPSENSQKLLSENSKGGLERGNMGITENNNIQLEGEENGEARTKKKYSFDNVEFIVCEDDALKEGLSDRLEKSQKVDSEKKVRKGQGSTLRIELRALEKDHKQIARFLRKGSGEQEDSDQDLEIIEKKFQTMPVKRMCLSRDQEKLQKLAENIKQFQEKWKCDYVVEANFEKGLLKVMVVKEKLTKYRVKPNTSINDENIQVTMRELLEALKVQGYSSLYIDNLTLDLKNCNNLSKFGLAYIFETMNSEFKNVRTLDLDFSLDQSNNHKSCPISIGMDLDLGHVEKLTLNFDNRCDIQGDDIHKIVESLEKSSRACLKFFTLSLPMFCSGVAVKNEINSKLDFLEKSNIFP